MEVCDGLPMRAMRGWLARRVAGRARTGVVGDLRARRVAGNLRVLGVARRHEAGDHDEGGAHGDHRNLGFGTVRKLRRSVCCTTALALAIARGCREGVVRFGQLSLCSWDTKMARKTFRRPQTCGEGQSR